MTREEAWAIFAAEALGQMMIGTSCALSNDGTLMPETRARVQVAAIYADAMADEWAARHRAAETEPKRKRPPESRL